MAQKKYKNPITFFREANEARQAKVKKSIKKAQDGIEMNDDIINKPGYSVGKSKEGFMNYTTPRIETQSISPNDPYERYMRKKGIKSPKAPEGIRTQSFTPEQKARMKADAQKKYLQ